jgi:hypothetical protein
LLAAEALLADGILNPKVGGLEQEKYPSSVVGAPAVVLGLRTDWIPAASKKVCTASRGLFDLVEEYFAKWRKVLTQTSQWFRCQ